MTPATQNQLNSRPAPLPITHDPRWPRIVARDKTLDGHVWYSVMTTGVYCRPSCPSRTANPENVMLHDTLENAQQTGFRPCKRCNPNGISHEAGNAALIAKACRMIEQSEAEPSLNELAEAVELSPSYFHRLFKSSTGLTPKAYASESRARRVREGLVAGASVTDSIYEAGFNSSGRFYEKSTAMLGMTPGQYRAGGANKDIRFAVGQSALGAILVACSTQGVAAILLGDDPDALLRELQDRFPKAQLIGLDRDYETLIARITTIKGIGRWTVEMLLMYSLERMDILPADDFGVREGYRVMKGLDEQPKPKSLREISQPWAPYRTVASWYLWRVPRERGNILEG